MLNLSKFGFVVRALVSKDKMVLPDRGVNCRPLSSTMPAGFGETYSDGAAAGSRAHDNIIAIGVGCARHLPTQNVLMNSIKAFLSSSLNAGSPAICALPK
jgi:hypothetical protein